MGSQLFEVLRQGIWASLTGGWFHDPRQPTLTNTIHLYLWLVLLALPLTLSAYFASTFITWSAYTGSVGVLFLTVKLLNCRFHYLFDTSEPIEEVPAKDDPSPEQAEQTFEAKLKNERPKNLGLAAADEIELQVMDSSSRIDGRMAHTQCLLDIEDNSPPATAGACGIGGDLKVDVHRKESSSSSSTTSNSVSESSWKDRERKRHKAGDTTDKNKETVEEIVVIEKNPSNKEDLEDLSKSCSIPICNDDNASPTSNEPSLSSADVSDFPRELKRFPTSLPSQSSELNPTSSPKETSLSTGYLLYLLHSEDGKVSCEETDQQFRRTQSAQETSSKESQRELDLPYNSKKSNRKGKPRKSESVTGLSLQNIPVNKPVGLKRSKSEDGKSKFSSLRDENDNDDDDQMEEAIRCRTPLLQRASENVRNEPEGTLEERASTLNEKKKQSSRFTKKVSFTTRSTSSSDSDGTPTELRNPAWDGKKSSTNSPDSPLFLSKKAPVEKKFALIPAQESLVGWNQSGGPFTSQWLFQAVNPTPFLNLRISPTPAAPTRNSTVEEINETESMKSDDSDGSHSFSGISKLFEAEDEDIGYNETDAERPKISRNRSKRPVPPKKPPRTVHSTKVVGFTPRMLLGADDDQRRRMGRSRTVDGRQETSPRILERLLEETQEHSGYGQNFPLQYRVVRPPLLDRSEEEVGWVESDLDANGIRKDCFRGSWRESERDRSVSSFRRPPRGRDRRSSSSGDAQQCLVTNPFLQSAREIKNHFRSFGPQTFLDISGGAVERQGSFGGNRSSNQLQGFFRARDDSPQSDVHSNAAAVNRHRRLRRLTQSRRTLERHREGSPVSHASTHLANSHDDTTEGALHYFQDEKGDWYSYTFSETGTASIVPAEPPPPSPRASRLSTILNRIDLGSSAFMEPRQGTSSSSRHPVASTSAQSAVIKTPSSSESWSSVSSSELAVDPSNHKLYSTTYRRGTHPTTGNNSQGALPSVPPIDYQAIASAALTHAMSGRTSMPLPGISGTMPHSRTWQRNPRDVLSVLTESFLERRRLPSGPYGQGEHLNSNGLPLSTDSNASKKQTKYYYWMNPVPLFASIKVKVSFDRLNLMAILDRNRTFLESLLAVLLAIGVASLGSFILHSGYFQNLSMVLLCIVMASCQFSLLKSVQPDAASPTHGFNHIVAFSRPVYFCLCGGLVFLLQMAIDHDATDFGWKIYGLDVTNRVLLTWTRDLILIIILTFPFLFCIGIFPQVNTFLIFLLEQIDIHIFGGNAAASLGAATVSNLKNWIAVGCLYGFAYGALGEKEKTQHILFSIFCSLLVPIAYHMSRCSSDATVMWGLLKQHLCPDEDCFGESTSTTAKQKEIDDQADPLPRKLRNTVNARLKSDTITCLFLALLVFALHASTVFTALQPGLTPVLCAVAVAVGFLLHYLIPQMRKQMPCLIMAHPLLLPREYNQYETRDAAKLMWFEKFYLIACFLERNILYPLMFISALTQEAGAGVVVGEDRFGLPFGSLVVVVTALKALRTSYSDPGKHYLVLTFTILFFNFDWEGSSETFVVDFFFMSILFHKVYELWLKLQFVTSYVSPWQISWGSAFHAFAQPFSVPHSAMLFLQALISSVFSAPLNPFLGSAIFITSYVRPIKFWERDYNTKRVDHSNTRLSSHLEKNPGADDNNLNSIFYEHLTRSLQDSLYGDIALGRWGTVSQGDCFVLASDYLNCLVHVIEIGNGLLTFQMRGLEFRGTYCQQREVEAISEGVEEDDGCCCCEPGHLPHMLSANAAFSQRFLAWEVTVSKYVLEGYSIADNSAVSMLQVYDLRKILITYYVKSVIFYTIKAEKLMEWLESDSIGSSLRTTLDKSYAELDPVFNVNIDEDYDFTTSGITRNSFCNVYHSWIQFCIKKRKNGNDIECGRDSSVVSLCFALSILARRALGIAAHSNSLSSVEFFLFGLHALFKGDFRITSQRDEWVFLDMDLLKKVVSPAVRMSLKLHQDHFMCPDEYDDHNALFDAISYHEEHLVISHEGDPAWRSAVLAGRDSLLALRHAVDDGGTDEYKIIMLNKRHLSFRVIKLNRECVRGLWAGQQQELVYLRNRDPERGSIQNAKQALRNIINSSLDQPIGYPIYVSPLTTSYAETHPQLTSLLGGPISLSKIKQWVIDLWRRIRHRCGQGCSSGSSSVPQEDGGDAYGGQEGTYAMAPSNAIPLGVLNLSASQSLDGSQLGGSSLGRGSVGRNLSRGSAASNVSFGKPSSSTLASLAGFLTDANGNSREKERGGVEVLKWGSLQKVRIVDANQVYDGLNMGRRIDVVWPDDTMRARGGRSFWQNWVPEDGMEGIVVHKWIPGHRDPKSRSITDKTILLLKIDEKFVPIAEAGVERIESEP